MIFSCDRCGRRYSVPDERVQGRAFRVTCKACGQVIQVRAGAPAAAVPDQGGAQAPARPPTAPPAWPPAPQATAVRPPAARPAPQPQRPAAQPQWAVPPSDPPAAQAAPPSPPAPPPTAEPPEVTPPFAMPSAAAPTVQQPRRPITDRGLSAAEMDWMSDRTERPGVPDGASEPRLEDALSDPGVPEEPPPPRGAERRTVLPRVAVAAAILLAAAAGAAALFWPRPRPAPVPPPPQVVRPEPPPPPVEPTPPPEPEPAAAVAPEPVEPPSPTTSRASFEPGTVKVARSRKKGGHQLSKKDREMLDLLGRKKDGAAPAEGVEQLDLDTGRSLQPAAVERVMSDSQGAFSGCVTRTSRGAWEPSRRATLLLTVDASGAVSAAWIAEKEVSRTRLGRCLASAGRRLAFPAFEGAPVDVSVPLVLEAR